MTWDCLIVINIYFSKSNFSNVFYHTYAMLDPATIKKHALERVKEITKSLKALVDSFELDLQKHLKQA